MSVVVLAKFSYSVISYVQFFYLQIIPAKKRSRITTSKLINISYFDFRLYLLKGYDSSKVEQGSKTLVCNILNKNVPGKKLQ